MYRVVLAEVFNSVLRPLGIPVVAAAAIALLSAPAASSAAPAVYWVSRVIDGDTIELGDGQRVRLVQIDTPEVYNGYECYGQEASAIAKRLLPAGTSVRLLLEPASDPVDRYGRLLRYVIRVRDGVNVNLRLVTVGAAAPWFLRWRTRTVLHDASDPREGSEAETARTMGSVPTNDLRPQPRRRDAAVRQGRSPATRVCSL